MRKRMSLAYCRYSPSRYCNCSQIACRNCCPPHAVVVQFLVAHVAVGELDFDQPAGDSAHGVFVALVQRLTHQFHVPGRPADQCPGHPAASSAHRQRSRTSSRCQWQSTRCSTCGFPARNQSARCGQESCLLQENWQFFDQWLVDRLLLIVQRDVGAAPGWRRWRSRMSRRAELAIGQKALKPAYDLARLLEFQRLHFVQHDDFVAHQQSPLSAGVVDKRAPPAICCRR